MPSVNQRPTFKETVLHRWLRRPYRLHVYDHGGSGPVMILLHGLASSSANWDPLIPLLKPHYRCITIDLLGFGNSPKPQWCGYSIDDHIRSIHHTVRSLRLRHPFILIGHSLGSLLATRYTRLHPRRVQRLVLLSPPVYMPPDTIENTAARQLTSLYLKAYRFLRTNPRVTPENFIRLSRILPIMKFLVLDRATWIPFIRSLERCIEQQTIVDDLAATSTPTDICYGLFDEVVVPYNVRQLAVIRDVTLHPMKVNHVVGKRYAGLVAEILNPVVEAPPKKKRVRKIPATASKTKS